MTFKAIFKAKRPKIQLRENNQNSDVLTKFQNSDVLTKFQNLVVLTKFQNSVVLTKFQIQMFT